MTAVKGDSLTMPDGTSFSTVESAADSGGKRVEFEVTMAPGAQGPPKHVHPRQVESWNVIEGELSLFVEGGWRTLGKGESLSIQPNRAAPRKTPARSPRRHCRNSRPGANPTAI